MRVVLHGTERFDDAIETFETMLSKMGQSPDPQIRGKWNHRFCDYINDLLTSSDRALWPVRQPINHTSDNSQDRSTNNTSFATRAHKHDHRSSLQQN